MTTSQELERKATDFLRSHGLNAIAQPKGKKSESVKASPTPCGGQPGWRRKRPR